MTPRIFDNQPQQLQHLRLANVERMSDHLIKKEPDGAGEHDLLKLCLNAWEAMTDIITKPRSQEASEGSIVSLEYFTAVDDPN